MLGVERLLVGAKCQETHRILVIVIIGESFQIEYRRA